MTQTQRDTFERGIGVLAAGNTTSEIQGNNPVAVTGVALPANTVVEGGQGERHYFPDEVLADAAEMLVGANIVKNFHELDGQAPADDVIGEVTDAAFSEGVGLVYEGELLDDDIAQRVAQGYLDVSPTVARSLGAYDDARDARQVDAIAGFRDLAIVQQGQPGAGIEIGENPAVAALQRDVLSRAFDGGDAGDGPDGGDAGDGADEDDDTDTMSLDDAKETLAEEYEVDVDDLDEHLDSLGDDDGGDPSDDRTVVLVDE